MISSRMVERKTARFESEKCFCVVFIRSGHPGSDFRQFDERQNARSVQVIFLTLLQ